MSTDTTSAARPATDIDRIADDYLAREVQLSPITATYLGITGHDEELDDYSPAGHEAQAALRAEVLDQLDRATPVDDIDRVTLAAMRERLGLAEEIHRAGIDEMALNVLASPLQSIRGCFDLMPTATDEDWGVISRRLEAVPEALTGWQVSLLSASAKGNITPRRQVEACIQQCADLVAADGYFATLVTHARLSEDTGPGELADSTKEALTSAAESASAAYAELGTWLKDHLLDDAPLEDACGEERYALLSRYFLGAKVDLAETYAWGQQEVDRITAEMEQVAEQIKPGSTVKEAIAALDADPTYQLHGTDELRAWMQKRADEAIAELAGTHFDIPDPVRTIECLIAPTQTGGIYYTGPSEDFSRPGRMWWSVPKGVTEFGTWKELTTVYHEGVPGHHLQVAQTVFRSERLNKWRRMAAWTSGHGEGWALYAERLMDELGFMDDPGNKMGLLDSQSLRAARVVIDIGVHCGFEAPAEVGGGEWTYDKAWQYLNDHANQGEAWLRFELDRYLGWPGQAPSYKIGERLWMQLRDQVAEREGDSFSLKDFHRRTLDLGGVGLDTLRAAVLGELT
ncbi:DUF885 domain-containing protein [Phycicoccus sp. Soil803]|uniref:DUF885 domain-containing protein n=1 Tax=Phycicoccus sp. Soil803 TaxID=1736415 RepID=UPI000708B3CA|nr:DUF885 domain-containing protein [Phycicoccus sp. Soil803]KRF24115.1 hypothetical protein ASG95_05755 [Phycicoccus sp. Soil803]